MKRGRPTGFDQKKIKKILRPYYQNGISANAASQLTNLNIKTILRYYKEWDVTLLQQDSDFLSRTKIAKEQSIIILDREINSYYEQEKEIDAMKNFAKRTGDMKQFERMYKIKTRVNEQKLKAISARTELINTPTADTIIKIEKSHGG